MWLFDGMKERMGSQVNILREILETYFTNMRLFIGKNIHMLIQNVISGKNHVDNFKMEALPLVLYGRSRKISTSAERRGRADRKTNHEINISGKEIARRIAVKITPSCLPQREMANNQSVRRHLDAFTRGRIIGKSEEGRSVTSQKKQSADSGEIARHTAQATGRPISRFTVARRLHGGGLFARRQLRCVPLTPAHRRRRSLWCREHRNWRDDDWGRVLFTHESRFSFSSDSHRILIWRERGSRNHPSNIIERDRYGGRGVLVWGGIMFGSRTDLHIFDAGSVNGNRYCNEILLPYVRLFRGAMALQFLFMDDNALSHRTLAAEQLLESEDIEHMDWPARSPDLNPIDHVWDFLGRRLAARTLPPLTIRELQLALQDELAAMPQQLIDTLILSMGRRCETCLAVRRDIIPYLRSDFSFWTPITGMFRPSVALRYMLVFQSSFFLSL
ncbi:transposable element Tcb2 transposase [Trichonephila clavipes]|nr:transposable element Tcb2 transposase [Trichonephila clavipes]